LKKLEATREKLIGKNIFEIISPNSHLNKKSLFKSIQLGEIETVSFKIELIDFSGNIIPFQATLNRLDTNTSNSTILLCLKPSELKQMTQIQFNQEKLESIGRLAGGIAHDFNNILTALLGNITLALEENDLEFIKATLKDAEKSIHRAQNLTTQLLTFATGGQPIKSKVDLTPIITETAIFSLRGSKSRCTLDFDHNLWPVVVDPNQISQVISNLVMNADQAMPDGGEIFIKFYNREFNNQVLKPFGNLNRILIPPGKYIEIIIRDEGTGIPEKIQTNIFEPYFSTKKSRYGLGLAAVYSIIKNHNGYIGFHTSEDPNNSYSEFLVYLPVQEEPPLLKKHLKTSKKELKKDNKKAETKQSILILEDDKAIQRILKKLLQHLHYETVFTENGEDTIQLYKEAFNNNHKFDLVILDLTIPGGLGGKEVIQDLRFFDPDIRAIVASGYSNDPIMANPSKYGFIDVLKKPFSLNQLREIITKII